MILDSLSNVDRYVAMHPNFGKAIDFLKSQDLSAIQPGKYPIDGEELFASVSLKDGSKVSDAKFEAHNSYIDIQYCISGKEKMGWRPRDTCTQPKGDFNKEKDVIFYSDTPDTYFELKEGQFTIFYPEDVHAPMIGEGPIKKIVIKIKLKHG
jgi:YhcH/YjgK/YiaL family protein